MHDGCKARTVRGGGRRWGDGWQVWCGWGMGREGRPMQEGFKARCGGKTGAGCFVFVRVGSSIASSWVLLLWCVPVIAGRKRQGERVGRALGHLGQAGEGSTRVCRVGSRANCRRSVAIVLSSAQSSALLMPLTPVHAVRPQRLVQRPPRPDRLYVSPMLTWPLPSPGGRSTHAQPLPLCCCRRHAHQRAIVVPCCARAHRCACPNEDMAGWDCTGKRMAFCPNQVRGAGPALA